MLLEKLRYLSAARRRVVFAGSLPRGVDEGFYAEAVRELPRRGAASSLDAEGEPLRRGIEAEPWLVSPNQHEAEQLVGQELEEEADFLMALDTIAEMGARNVHITIDDRLLRARPRGAPGAPLPSRRAAARAGLGGRRRRRRCSRSGSPRGWTGRPPRTRCGSRSPRARRRCSRSAPAASTRRRPGGSPRSSRSHELSRSSSAREP